MSNNVIFTDDKLKIEFINQKTLFSGGSVSILYRDISSLSLIKNTGKIWYQILGLGITLFEIYNGSNNYYLIAIGLVILLWGSYLPSNFLGVETRGGSQYWVNVKGRDIHEVIDEIENKRRVNW